MDETIGQAVFVIQIDDAGAQQQLNQWQSNLDKTMNDGKKSTKSLADGFDSLRSSIAQLATAGLAFSGLSSGIGSVVEAYNQYEASMNGVKAVASATGNDIASSISAIKDITAGGLISQSDAAAAMKNLQLYGYSVKEATQLINIMADAAVYNRQANYSVSEAVRVTTEGIRMENSVLSDASGITKNIAKMYEEYAAQLGKSTNELTKAEKAQAVYNGVLAEGGIFAGNAEEYANSLAGAQQKLSTAIQEVKQTMGSIVAEFSPIVNGLADWISNNEDLIVRIGVFTAVLAGGAGLVTALKLVGGALVTAGAAFVKMSVMAKVATLSIVGILGAIATLAATIGVSSILDTINDTTDGIEELGDGSKATSEDLDTLGNSASKTAKKIAKLEEQLADLDRDYARDLKQIAVKHEENLKTLTQQIEEANVDYRRAIDERMADFNVTLAKQERSHQETVDELMGQLNFLQRYNNQYNKEKLAQVEFALAKEEQLYKNETEKQRAEIELQNAADKEKLDKKLKTLQEELDEEMAFMNKHRDELKVVQHTILLDEIESLNERYEKQKASYQDQIAEARFSGSQIGNSLGVSINDTLREEIDKINLVSSGIEIGKQIMNGIGQGLQQAGEGVWSWMKQGGIVKNIWDAINPKVTKGGPIGGWADGGYTGRGAPDEVAGVVHKGEYVLPANQVDQNTGEPKVSTTQNITINLTGVLATSAQAKRELAQDIVKAIQQTNQSRLTSIGGIA